MQSNHGAHGAYGAYGANGANGQFRFTGHQQLNGHPGFIRQQHNHVNGRVPPTPIQISYSPAVSMPHGLNTPQGHIPGQTDIAAQQNVNIQGLHHAMPSRNLPGAPTSFQQENVPGIAQHTQYAHPQAQQGFARQQGVNTHGWNPMMAIETNPRAMTALTDLWTAFAPQPGQAQIRQVNQKPQGFQNHENIYQSMPSTAPPKPVRVRQHTAIGHAPQATVPATAPATPVSTPKPGVSEKPRPVDGTQISEDFQEHVNQLLEQRDGQFKGYIRNKADVARYERAVKEAKAKNSKVEDKSAGYPTNESERLDIIRRISDAFFKLDGTQDPVSDSDDNNGAAFKAVRGTSPIEVEILADKLVVSATGTCIQ